MVSGKRVAIPVFRGRVSPVFDWAELLLLSEPDGVRREVSLSGLTPPGRVDRLTELGVDVLLCCGISQALLTLAEARRIDVRPHVAGEVDEIFTAYTAGGLMDGRFAMPGCRCLGGPGRGMRKRRGRGCQGGRR